MKILVTGAGGFVGKAIVAEISQFTFEVYELLKLNSKYNTSEDIKKSKNFFWADITNYQSLIEAVKIEKIDVVIHAAGLAHQFGRQAKDDFWRINVLGAVNTAKLAVSLKARHFILISSVSAYGEQKKKKNENIGDNSVSIKGISEDADCRPQNFYAQSKLESEKAVTRVCEENKMALTILRLATVIGEEDRGNVARLINSIDKKRFVWIGNGENLKSLIYKGDAAKACVKVLDKTSGIEIFNVTSDAVKMKEIVSEISFSLGKKIPGLTISPKLLDKIFSINANSLKIKKVKNIAATLSKWLSDDVFSGEKFKKVYGFQTETPLEDAIKRQVESYKKSR